MRNLVQLNKCLLSIFYAHIAVQTTLALVWKNLIQVPLPHQEKCIYQGFLFQVYKGPNYDLVM